MQAILNLRQLGSTVVLVTHKPNILSIVDNIILMQEGQIALMGSRDDVLQKLEAARQEQMRQAELARMQQESLNQSSVDDVSSEEQEAKNNA